MILIYFGWDLIINTKNYLLQIYYCFIPTNLYIISPGYNSHEVSFVIPTFQFVV